MENIYLSMTFWHLQRWPCSVCSPRSRRHSSTQLRSTGGWLMVPTSPATKRWPMSRPRPPRRPPRRPWPRPHWRRRRPFGRWRSRNRSRSRTSPQQSRRPPKALDCCCSTLAVAAVMESQVSEEKIVAYLLAVNISERKLKSGRKCSKNFIITQYTTINSFKNFTKLIKVCFCWIYFLLIVKYSNIACKVLNIIFKRQDFIFYLKLALHFPSVTLNCLQTWFVP